jgi:Tfp pilus assembly protein PilN
MIEINLLEKKRSLKVPVVLGVDLAEINWKPLIFTFLIMYFVPPLVEDFWTEERALVQSQVDDLDKKVKDLRKDLKKNRNIKDKLVAFNKQIAKLKERSQFVDKIIRTRTNPRHILEKIARSAPENVWLEELNINEKKEITINGGSTDYKSIGDFIVEANESPFFNKSLQLGDSKTIKEEKQGVEIRVETFSIKGTISVYDPFMQ